MLGHWEATYIDKLQLETKMALGNEAGSAGEADSEEALYRVSRSPRETEAHLLLLLQARRTCGASAVSMACLT